MKFLFEYSIKENLRKKCNFLVCLITCFLVSSVCLVVKSLINQGYLIFLVLAEKYGGEIDFAISPNPIKRNSSLLEIDDFHIDHAFINYTKFGELMNEPDTNNEEEEKKDDNEQNPYNYSTIRTYFQGCSPYNDLRLILIDTEREKNIDLGRNYPYSELKEGECLVNKKLIIDEVKAFNISILMENFLNNTLLYYYYDTKKKGKKMKLNPGLKHLKEFDPNINFTCKIVDIFKDNYGKQNFEHEDIVIMEQKYFYKYISKFISKEILEYFPDYPKIVAKIKPQDYGNLLILNFPKNRINYYMEADYENLLDKGIKYMNKIIIKLGTLQNYNVDMPIIQSMNGYKYGNTLLNMVLNIILLSIFGLSLILIYSLLLITIETHTFEFGVLRLVGNTKKSLIIIIFLECIYFSIPAFILALIASHFILGKINEMIMQVLNIDLNITFTWSSFIIAFLLNFLGPIISSIFSIRNILRKNVAISMNTILNKTQGIKIEVISLQQKELTSLVIFGLINFIYGTSIYYFFPLSLLSMNFGMIGLIFLWILFGILLGFVLLSRNIEYIFQIFLTYTLLFFTKGYIKFLIIKNLATHKLKNKKACLMFSLSVGVFIMASVGFDLIMQSTKKIIIVENGGEILVYKKNNYFTPAEIMNPMMELYNKNLINSFSYFTIHLDYLCKNSNSFVSNYGKIINSRQKFIAINTDYFSKETKGDLIVSKQNKKYKNYTPAEQLYFSENKGKVGISGLLKYSFGANLNSDILLKIKDANQEMTIISKPAFILDSASGLSMSHSPSSYITRELIMSIPLYLEILQKCRNYFSYELEDFSIINYKNLPIWGIIIFPKENVTEKEIDEINSILRLIKTRLDIWIFANSKNSLNITANIVYLIFYIVSIIVLIFCLFNLTASLTINIFEQKKEIAIFRALGMIRKSIIFIYIGESFILILSSSIIGSIIGIIISYTMVLQWTVFTGINVTFNFPVGGMIIIFSFSIFGGIISTFFSSKKILNYSIAQIIKLI